MGHGAKRSAHAAGGHLRQSYAGLVALRKRTRVGSCGLYENPRQRMSVLRRKKAQAGFNDLATQYPELARQWDYTKNIPVLPADVTTGSHRLVWWKCEKDIAGEHLSAHAYLAMAARYALGGSFLQEKTIWQPGSRNWHRNGIGRKTAR